MGWLSSLWSWWDSDGAVPNANPPSSVGPGYDPGDPHGVTMDPLPGNVQTRMAAVVPSNWDGWPSGWGSPLWGGGGGKFGELVDTAWAAIDLNASVLSSMPPYRLRNGEVLPPTSWMTNPDPTTYTSWTEFAKQLFWEYQLGETFVLPMSRDATGFPFNFRVIPQWLVNVEMAGGRRIYNIGSLDVSEDILHIRYKSSTDSARGIGPLESGRTRMVAVGVLARYATEIAQGGGIPKYVLEVDRWLNRAQADELLEVWMASRMARFGQTDVPGVLSGGAKAKPLQLSPEEMSLIDLEKYAASRIAVLLGVPPTLLGLPTEDSSTYKNVQSLFDFHDRAGLNPKVQMVMPALSGWALPRGQSVELNRDEYTRPSLLERAEVYEKLIPLNVLSAPEARVRERFVGDAPQEALTGGGRDAAQSLPG